jgi:hypothetical protein
MENKMPDNVKQKIKSLIHQKLSPSWTKVYVKLAIIQLISSFFVLTICPQFNLGFNTHSFLGHILMSFGEFACNFACGAIFLGVGTFFSIIFLTFDELRVLKNKEFPSFLSLGSFALAAFVVLGVEFHFVMFLAWLIGGVMSAVGSLELFFKIIKAN